jgi:hypothetical protein
MILKKIMYKKRGVFFTLDALMALTIILLTMLVFYPKIRYSENSNLIQKDVLTVLSSLKIGEYNASCGGCLNNYIESPNDLNKSVLEKIGEFYVVNLTKAKNLSKIVFDNLNVGDDASGIGLYFEDELIASKNSSVVGDIENAENVMIEKRYISGIASGENLTGYSSKAYLTNTIASRYFYFGGYAGEGEIYGALDYNGDIDSANLDIATDKKFDIWIKSPIDSDWKKYETGYNPGEDEFTPVNISLQKNDFSSGLNLIKIKYHNQTSTEDLHISGGYIRINYVKNMSDDLGNGKTSEKIYFPGVIGLVNLYDSFYVPGTLTEMEIGINFTSNYSYVLTVGNTTLFNKNSNGSKLIVFNNSNLSSTLNYNELSNKTIPFRFGMYNVSYDTANADVFSAADLSGSMNPLFYDSCQNYRSRCCGFTACRGDKTKCENCGGTYTDKLQKLKEATYSFVDIILNSTENKIGLVGYKRAIYNNLCHDLSTNNVSLKNVVNSWYSNLGDTTCICCGVNEAVDRMLAQSNPSRNRTIIVMSDGQANEKCSGRAGQGISPTEDARIAAAQAWSNGIRVYTIGFGPVDEVDQNTLILMAAAGNGTYYYSAYNDLGEVFKRIAGEIIKISYKEQKVEFNISKGVISKLYPKEGYIILNYTSGLEQPYGLILTIEKQFDNELGGQFYIPPDSQVMDTNVVSYSGPRWTNNVSINGISVYNLDNYKRKYVELGDPFVINIPTSLVKVGENNTINLTTGSFIGDKQEGSENNKIIYTIKKNISAYSGVYAYANGCNWTVKFSDNYNISFLTPLNYTGDQKCYYNEVAHSTSKSIDDKEDSLQKVIFDLLEQLDFNNDGKVDAKFTEDDLQIQTSEISGIPYFWSTEVQVRKWY